MYTIGKLVRKFHISRSTLLYYDLIGLLKPPKRNCSNYRIYFDKDCDRLEKIILYREAGISLEKIRGILEAEQLGVVNELQKRQKEICEEIQLLREQQYYVIKLLTQSDGKDRLNIGKLKIISDIFESAGVTRKARWLFHNRLESRKPDNHQAFLEMLGLNLEEVQHCREWSVKSDVNF